MKSAAKSPLGIRPARTNDPREVDRLYDICLRTGNNGMGAQDLLQEPRLLGEIYVGAYLHFEPELAFVLENPDGTALGFVLGARDTLAFEELLQKQWWSALRERYPLDLFPAGSFDADLVEKIHTPARTNPATIAQFPAHLHINILDEGQGGGNGRRLLETLFSALRDRGISAIHLGVSPQNFNAIGFYEHLGFNHVRDNSYGMDL